MYKKIKYRKILLASLLLVITLISRGQVITPDSYLRAKRVEAIDSFRLRGIWYKTLGSGLDSVRFRSSQFVDSVFTYGNQGTTLVGVIDRETGRIRGGYVTHDSGYVYSVTACDYIINSERYHNATGSITLDSSFGALPRFDIIGVDSLGHIFKITGVPGVNPAVPETNPANQLALAIIYIPAGGVVDPVIKKIQIYDENNSPPEWIPIIAEPSADFNDGNFPLTGLKQINWSLPGVAGRIVFDGSLTELSEYNTLRLSIKLTQPFSEQIRDLRLVLYNSGNSASSNVLVVNSSHGFDKTIVGSYQNITVPLTEFAITGNKFDQLIINVSDQSNTLNVYLDNIFLQGGITQSGGSGGNNYVSRIFKKPGTDSIYYTIGLSNFFAFRDSVGSSSTSNGISKLGNGYGLIKVNDSTYRVDTSLIKTVADAQADSTALANAIAGKIGPGDTLSISTRINQKQNIVTLTTTGTSGTATFNQSTGALNIPQYSGGGTLPDSSSNAPNTLSTKVFAQSDTGNVRIDGGVLKRLVTPYEFSPNMVDSLKAWYDFTNPSTLTLVSGLISQANDISGAGNHLVQATAGSRPTYNAYGGLNDYGYASFTSGKNIAKTVAYAQPYTIFMVVKVSSFADGALIMDFQSATNGIAQKSVAYGDMTHQTFGPVANSNWQIFPFENRSDYMVVGWVVDGSVLNTTKRILNGVIGDDNSMTANSGGSAGITKIQLGSNSTFEVYEILFYNKALSNLELSKVEGFLRAKYEVARKTIYFFGDSITNGSNSSSNKAGFALRVAVAKNMDHHIIATNGTGFQSHFKQLYVNALRSAPKDSYIIISYGSNDYGVVNSTWNTDLRKAIQNLIKMGFIPSHIVLATPLYHSTRVAGLTNMQSYFSQASIDFGVKYANCVAAGLANGGDALLSDGTHPGNTGHQIIANTILAVMN